MTTYPLKTCLVCKQPYGLNGRKPNQYLRSEYCSRNCSGLGQRNTIDSIIARIAVNQETGCHLWTGQINKQGYGMVMFCREGTLVHRLMWMTKVGPIPKELQIDHLCGVKACCNVEHLRLCTARENTLALTSNNMGARNARKICCPKCNGPYSIRPNGLRYCKPCRHASVMEYQREHRDKGIGPKKPRRPKENL
jgi:hypothetical protein